MNIIKKQKNIISIFCSKQFLTFLLIGGTAALINFFSRFYFSLFLPFVASVACAFTAGTIVSFILNKTITFKSYDEHTMIQLLKFILIAIVGILLGSIIAGAIIKLFRTFNSFFLCEKYLESSAHIAAIGVCTIYNFFAMKYFSFRQTNILNNVTEKYRLYLRNKRNQEN